MLGYGSCQAQPCLTPMQAYASTYQAVVNCLLVPCPKTAYASYRPIGRRSDNLVDFLVLAAQSLSLSRHSLFTSLLPDCLGFQHFAV